MNISKFTKNTIYTILFCAFGACSHENNLKRITCNISIHSTIDGGRFDLSKIPKHPTIPIVPEYKLFWHIPSSNSSLDFIVAYGNELIELKDARVARARFVLPSGIKADKFSAEVIIEDNTALNFDDSAFKIGYDIGDIIFKKDNENGRILIDAIENGKKFKLTLLNDSHAFAASTFYSFKTEGRDMIYAEAKKIVERADPKYCRKI